jgi:hypothetical protein
VCVCEYFYSVSFICIVYYLTKSIVLISPFDKKKIKQGRQTSLWEICNIAIRYLGEEKMNHV